MFSNFYTNRDYSYIIQSLVIATRQEYLYTFYEETYAIDSKSYEHIELDFYLLLAFFLWFRYIYIYIYIDRLELAISEIEVNNRITNQKHTYCGFIYYVNPLKVCLCFLYFHHEQAIKLFIYYLWNAFYHPVQ